MVLVPFLVLKWPQKQSYGVYLGPVVYSVKSARGMCGVVRFRGYWRVGGGGPSRPILLGLLELLCHATPLDMCAKCREQFANSFLTSAVISHSYLECARSQQNLKLTEADKLTCLRH